jgi:hypothetical protein
MFNATVQGWAVLLFLIYSKMVITLNYENENCHQSAVVQVLRRMWCELGKFLRIDDMFVLVVRVR